MPHLLFTQTNFAKLDFTWPGLNIIEASVKTSKQNLFEVKQVQDLSILYNASNLIKTLVAQLT